jgi:hypothetical protein
MKAVLIAGGILLSGAAQAHTLVDAGVGFPVPPCDECGTVRFSGGRYHSDAVRMTIDVGSAAEHAPHDGNFMYVAFRLDSFVPSSPDTICFVQLERGPEHKVINPATGIASVAVDSWPFSTSATGYYDQKLGAYVVRLTSPEPTAFRMGAELALSAFCPARNK